MSEKKLYEVEIEDRIYVMAESSAEAEAVAMSEFKYDFEFDYNAFETDTCFHVWQNEIPYNSDDNKTVGQICEELQAEKKKKQYMQKHYRPLPFDIGKK